MQPAHFVALNDELIIETWQKLSEVSCHVLRIYRERKRDSTTVAAILVLDMRFS
jgi:hypothetical protein